MEIIKISLILLLYDSLKSRQLAKKDPTVSKVTRGASSLQGRPLLEASQGINAHFRHQTPNNGVDFMKAKDY